MLENKALRRPSNPRPISNSRKILQIWTISNNINIFIDLCLHWKSDGSYALFPTSETFLHNMFCKVCHEFDLNYDGVDDSFDSGVQILTDGVSTIISIIYQICREYGVSNEPSDWIKLNSVTLKTFRRQLKFFVSIYSFWFSI